MRAADTTNMERGDPALVHVRTDSESFLPAAGGPRGEDDALGEGLGDLALIPPANEIGTEHDRT